MIIPYQDYAQQIRAFSRSTMIYSSTEVSWSIWKRLLDNRSKTDEKPLGRLLSLVKMNGKSRHRERGFLPWRTPPIPSEVVSLFLGNRGVFTPLFWLLMDSIGQLRTINMKKSFL